MIATYTVDASVFLNAFNPYEPGHDTSHPLLALFQERAIPIIVPSLLRPEVSAAIIRGREDADLARRFTHALERLPHIVWVPLDNTLARQSADLAASCRLRGSDAVYVAVALRFGSALVTLDREQRERAAGVISSYYPTEALTEIEF